MFFGVYVTKFFVLFRQDGLTSLMAASVKGHSEVVKLLLSHADVDVNVQDKVNCSLYRVSVCMDITR